MDSKRNERAEQWRRQNRTDAVLVNAAAVKGAHTMCATVTASPTPAKLKAYTLLCEPIFFAIIRGIIEETKN